MPEINSIIRRAVLLIVVLWPGVTGGQTPAASVKTIRISGRAVASSGATIPAAQVMLNIYDDLGAATQTDSSGKFAFDAVPARRYKLSIQATQQVGPYFKGIVKFVDGEAGNDIDLGDLCLCEIVSVDGPEPPVSEAMIYEVVLPSIPPGVLEILRRPLEDRSRSIALSAILHSPTGFAPPEPIKATLCDLYKAPRQYAGKLVEVRASISGRHEPRLSRPSQSAPCAASMKIALELPRSVKPTPEFDLVEDAAFLSYQDALRRGMSISATLVGRFDYAKRHATSGRLVLRAISNLSIGAN